MKVATKNIFKVIYSDREDVFTYHHQSSTIVNFARFFEWKVAEGKGHIKLKAVWLRRLNLFCLPWKAKSKQNKFICLFFGRIYGAPICFWFYLTFKMWITSEIISTYCAHIYRRIIPLATRKAIIWAYPGILCNNPEIVEC